MKIDSEFNSGHQHVIYSRILSDRVAGRTFVVIRQWLFVISRRSLDRRVILLARLIISFAYQEAAANHLSGWVFGDDVSVAGISPIVCGDDEVAARIISVHSPGWVILLSNEQVGCYLMVILTHGKKDNRLLARHPTRDDVMEIRVMIKCTDHQYLWLPPP